MRATIVTAFDKPLEIRDLPGPTPAADQVLVRIEASGLCHTDIHAARGDWPIKPTLPFTPGHEGVGIVEQVGAAATDPVAEIQAPGRRRPRRGLPPARRRPYQSHL